MKTLLPLRARAPRRGDEGTSCVPREGEEGSMAWVETNRGGGCAAATEGEGAAIELEVEESMLAASSSVPCLFHTMFLFRNVPEFTAHFRTSVAEVSV